MAQPEYLLVVVSEGRVAMICAPDARPLGFPVFIIDYDPSSSDDITMIPQCEGLDLPASLGALPAGEATGAVALLIDLKLRNLGDDLWAAEAEASVVLDDEIQVVSGPATWAWVRPQEPMWQRVEYVATDACEHLVTMCADCRGRGWAADYEIKHGGPRP